MSKSIFRALAGVALIMFAATAAGCSTQDECLQSDNPSECSAWRDAGGSVKDYLIGGMAGYMLAKVTSGGQQRTVIVANPSYHGPTRHLHSAILSRDMQIQRMQAKIDRQRAELARQQAAHARKNAQISAMRSSGFSRPVSTFRSSSFRSSSFRK